MNLHESHSNIRQKKIHQQLAPENLKRMQSPKHQFKDLFKGRTYVRMGKCIPTCLHSYFNCFCLSSTLSWGKMCPWSGHNMLTSYRTRFNWVISTHHLPRHSLLSNTVTRPSFMKRRLQGVPHRCWQRCKVKWIATVKKTWKSAATFCFGAVLRLATWVDLHFSSG